jgi:hypothetical protein
VHLSIEDFIMSRLYGPETQYFTFGVHGTNNEPSNVRNLAAAVSAAAGNANGPGVPNLFDNGFSWKSQSHIEDRYDPATGLTKPVLTPVKGTAHLGNNEEDRGIAADKLANHVLGQIKRAVAEGKLDPNEPLVVNLAGFSYGGTVSLEASPKVAEGLEKMGFKQAGIHVGTFSTPAQYNGSKEDPDVVKRQVEAHGVKFAHSHMGIKGDGVADHLAGRDYEYKNTDVTRQRILPAPSNGIEKTTENHGLLQDNPIYIQEAKGFMESRFRGLAPAKSRADAGDSEGISVAMAKESDKSQGSDAKSIVGEGSAAKLSAGAERVEQIALANGSKPASGFEDINYNFMIGRNGPPLADSVDNRLQRPSTGDPMLDVINDRYFNIDSRLAQNPHAGILNKIMDSVQSPELTPHKNLDVAAYLVEKASAQFDPNKEGVVAGHGKNGNIYLADGVGDTAKVVAVNIRDTNIDGAAERLVKATIAQAPDQTQPALTQEPDQHKPKLSSFA